MSEANIILKSSEWLLTVVMPAHYQSNVMVCSKMVVLNDVDYLGPDGCPRPMLLGRKNQYQAVKRLVAQ